LRLVVCLFVSPPVTDDGSVAAERTSPRQQTQRNRGLGLAFSLRQCDKKNHGWREGLPLKRTLPGIDLVTGLHPPGKSVPDEKRIPLSDALRALLTD
jgi:hypothetical protein